MAFLIGFYNYTVYLTYLGLSFSVVGIFLAMGGNITAAVICLLLSGVCDMFDGKLARTKKDRTSEEKSFGIQIDSLCDIVCFGIFPAVLSYSIGATAWWQLAVAAFFVLCGVIRLAFFNVTEELRQSCTDKKRSTYLGLPITSSAIMAPLLMCFQPLLGRAFPFAYTVLLALLGVFYIAPINVRKPGRIGAIVMICAGACVLIALLT